MAADELRAAFTRPEDDQSLSALLTTAAYAADQPQAQAAQSFVKGVLARVALSLEDGDPTNSLEADLDGLTAQFLSALGL